MNHARNDFRDYTLEYKDLHICDRAYFYNEKNIPPFWSQQEAGLTNPYF